ncbi:MAG: hypothetical protein KQI35_17270 [Bacteroidetes bacterium]|nr:hypothetical protein [Bacteroidota bacterium]
MKKRKKSLKNASDSSNGIYGINAKKKKLPRHRSAVRSDVANKVKSIIVKKD